MVVIKYDNARKYWLRLKTVDLDDGRLPETFINAFRKKDHIECQTLSLVKLNCRLSDASNEVIRRSDLMIQDLVNRLLQDIPHLFRICESIALIDMISAFTQLAATQNYVRPEITGTLGLESARHPILDKVSDFSGGEASY